MRKILVGIPVLSGPDHCYKAIHSVFREADVLIVDNGSPDQVKRVLQMFPCYIITNEVNEYVNPAWNKILSFFLKHTEYETLIIMNSDLIMRDGWSGNLDPLVSCIPSDGSLNADQEVTEGTPGVFIHLSRYMAKMVYPIPDGIKVWFGDQWMYTKLRNASIKTVVKKDIIAYHYHNGSQTVQRTPDISEIIEQDKVAWKIIEKSL